jgi:cytosine/adenosine deaminase-related metal-dependent hydrolase
MIVMAESTLVKNGLVVTCDAQGRIFPGYVKIEGNKIVEVGKGEPRTKSDTTVDASGCVVIPGLITAHTHLYGILLRGATLDIEPPTDFAQILQRVWWPLDEALTVQDAEASALAASADMIRNGSTFFADTYSGPNSIEGVLDAIAEATQQIGVRSVLAFEVTERNGGDQADRGIKENVRFAKACAKTRGLASAMMSLHASFTANDELIARAAEIASANGIPLTIHTSEGLVDLYHNLETKGERTVERLARLGVLRPRTVLAHCVHVNGTELELMRKHQAAVAHNPMSNMLNAVGTAPVPDMLAKGITVGLGNDGWIFDPFENMRCALTVHRLATRNPSVIGPEQVFRMATIDGAKCYGLDNLIGSIEAGKLADMVVLDASRVPTPVDSTSVVGHLVNTFTGKDVLHVFVNGRPAVWNGKLKATSDDFVSATSRESARALWSRLPRASRLKKD